jgi:hypothetical protein
MAKIPLTYRLRAGRFGKAAQGLCSQITQLKHVMLFGPESQKPLKLQFGIWPMDPWLSSPPRWRLLVKVSGAEHPWPKLIGINFNYHGDEVKNPALLPAMHFLADNISNIVEQHAQALNIDTAVSVLQRVSSPVLYARAPWALDSFVSEVPIDLRQYFEEITNQEYRRYTSSPDGFHFSMDFNDDAVHRRAPDFRRARYGEMNLLFRHVRSALESARPELQALIDNHRHLQPSQNPTKVELLAFQADVYGAQRSAIERMLAAKPGFVGSKNNDGLERGPL